MWERTWLTWALVESQLWANRSIISRVALGSYKFAIGLDTGPCYGWLVWITIQITFEVYPYYGYKSYTSRNLRWISINNPSFQVFPHVDDEKFRARGNAYLKLWYCGYYVIDDGTHEVVRWKKRPLFRTPGSASHFNHVDGNGLYWKKSDKYRVHLGEIIPMCEVQYWMGKKMVCQ